MSSVDKIRNLGATTINNTVAGDNQRVFVQAENNKRTERFNLRVRGQVDITVAGAGLSNRGSILGALRDVGFTDGGKDVYVTDARLAQFIGNALAPSALPSTRLAGAGVQAATQLEDVIPLWLCAAKTGNPNETKYVEVNKQLALQPFITPLKLITGVANGAALAGTVTNVTATVEQVFDDMVMTPPWLTVFQRQIVQNVNGANAALKVDLRGSRFIRAIGIQQDTNQGEVSDIINQVVLRGDAFSIIGDRGVPFLDLQRAQSEEIGGELPAGYLWIDFCRYGRLSTMWNPYQDTNLRFELDVQPSVTVFGGAAATGSVVRVAVIEYEKTAATAAQLPVSI